MVKVTTIRQGSMSDEYAEQEHADGQELMEEDGHLYVSGQNDRVVAIHAPGRWACAVVDG